MGMLCGRGVGEGQRWWRGLRLWCGCSVVMGLGSIMSLGNGWWVGRAGVGVSPLVFDDGDRGVGDSRKKFQQLLAIATLSSDTSDEVANIDHFLWVLAFVSVGPVLMRPDLAIASMRSLSGGAMLGVMP